jgi:hypothetical protein
MDGLGDDDHTQYLLTSGARNVTGAMIFESGVTINALANDADTRMEGDTIDDVFFLNAGDNSIIIGGRDIAVDEGYSFGIQSKTGPDFTDVANFAGMMLGDVEGGGRVLNLSYLDYDTGVYQADFSIFSTNLYFNPDTGAWVDLDATRYGVYYGQSSRAATDSGHYFYLTPAVSSTTLTELFSMTWANGIVLNETGADLNLRAESDNNANMFVLDAGADFIGIGTATQGGDAILSIDDPTTWGGSVTSFTGVDIGHNTNGTQMRLAVLDHASVDGVIAQIAANARWEPSTAAWAQSSSGDASVVMEFLTGEADPHFRIFTFDAASTTARYHLRVGFNETVVNDSGLDTDFRVESDDDSHSMFLNANDNQWFFGYNAAPTTFATAPNIATFGDGTASIGIAIHSGTAHLGTLAFADGTTSTAQYRGYVEYDHNTDIMTIGASAATILTLTGGGGVQIGAPTGGDKGAGTLNAAADIYKNNSAYTNPDYVLEHYYTNEIVQFADRPGASEYAGLMSIKDVAKFTQDNYHLPWINRDPSGIFDRGDMLLIGQESLVLYIAELESKIDDLEHRLAQIEAML